MISKIILAGFGGQGIIVAGKILATAAMNEGKEVTYFPSYGAEMRGGTCNCSVVISDKTIASPVINEPDIILIFNKPSKDKYETTCKENGLIIYNSSLINEKSERNDIKSFYVDASKIADKNGSIKATNMAMLGALSKVTNIVKIDSLINSLKEVFPTIKEELLQINIKTMKSGYEI